MVLDSLGSQSTQPYEGVDTAVDGRLNFMAMPPSCCCTMPLVRFGK